MCFSYYTVLTHQNRYNKICKTDRKIKFCTFFYIEIVKNVNKHNS
uniref:Uncharacterized protein n=1 Tax=Anguilla anguilla TaxID=7936 RepID=A0A0E9PGB8_ANGAN